MAFEYEYRFDFPSGRQEVFRLALDEPRLTPVGRLADNFPAWTHLEFMQCSTCTLRPQEHRYCPLAARLVEVADRMGDVVSYHAVDVTVVAPERAVTRSLTAQDGISSLLGIIAATSGCPHTAFFKPMARFHLPFATVEETYYRAASMYMLGQHFRRRQGLPVDLSLTGLRYMYQQVEMVNQRMADRLRTERRQDGTINALVLLDAFVKCAPHSLDDVLQDLAPLFEPYLHPLCDEAALTSLG